jgi:hypothetical protein
MSAAIDGPNEETRDMKSMTKNGRPFGARSRNAARLGILGLLLVVMGDRGGAVVDRGIDPLEVLNLEVKPNVIVVLDSSGSMQETVGGTGLNSGDHPRSKMFQAKQVLKTVVNDNQDKVTFLFGQYTQDIYTGGDPDNDPGVRLRTLLPDPNNNNAHYEIIEQDLAGEDRFQYTTNSEESPQMVTTELTLPSDGFRTFQDIKAGWNVLHMAENGTNCDPVIPVGFYTGATLATALKTAMETCPTSNTYNVTYDATDGDFSFVRAAGTASWNLRFSNATNSIGTVINADNVDHPLTTGTYTTEEGISLLRREGSDEVVETTDFDGDGDTETVTNYTLIASRLWNGQTIKVTSAGATCGITEGTATNPPTVKLQQVAAGCGADVGTAVTFTFAGGYFAGNSVSCDGFQSNVDLVRCDNTSLQAGLIAPFLRNELHFDSNNAMLDYSEVTTDGTYRMATTVVPGLQGGIKASGSTPVANSLRDIRNNVWGTSNTTGLWGAGLGPVSAVKDHTDPKERTIVLFVTDGDDTCADSDPGGSDNDDGIAGEGDEDALAAAWRASRLYTRLDAAQAASSVTTYVVGFGSGASTKRLNWIAWGGSGLGQGATGDPLFISNNGGRWTPTGADVNAWTTDLQGKRNLCATCVDAFIAPDADTLASVIQSILDQGATIGEFTAQQSVTESVFEWVAEVPGTFQGDAFNPNDPDSRFVGIVPALFRSSFSLPGFKGQLKAFTNEGGAAFTRWNAGQILVNTVINGPGNDNGSGLVGMGFCGDGPTASGCTFEQVTRRIKRRIYTTSSNGVFPVTIANYFSSTWLRDNGNRVQLWPPVTAVRSGALDDPMGLNDLAVVGETEAQRIVRLKAEFGACMGTPLPPPCTGGTDTTRLAHIKKEAREITLAYMAGAEMVLAANGQPERGTVGATHAEIMYKSRSWILSSSTLGDAAIAPPPVEASPEDTGFGVEYEMMRNGPRSTSDQAQNVTPPPGDFGLGLRNPDADDLDPATGAGGDTRVNLKPTMTVVYLPANDMLHAFRAGPSAANAAAPPNCTVSATLDCGGEELWGYVPHDQLEKLRERLRPQTRANHTYMLASAMRFSDIFVPNAGTTGNFDGTTTQTHTIGSATTPPMKGVWRRVIFFGRGIGGKYVSALDVTSPGPFTRDTKDTGSDSIIGPIPLWNRGNPDTGAGTRGGSNNNSAADLAAYAKMGETWSTPAIAHVNKLHTTRKPCPGARTGLVCDLQTAGGVQFVAFMGSGYGETTAEGTTFFTLDALTGDVIASVDVGSRGGVPGGYANALVADAVSFNVEEFVTDDAEHPLNAKTERVYIGDLHGRVWKFQASDPATAIEFADLGADQPIGAAVSLLNLPPGPTGKPHVFVSTGNDTRQSTTNRLFKIAGFRDDTPAGAGTALFNKNMETLFRGTVQPATAFAISGTSVLGRVFFGGTRFIPPPPASTLSTPIATSGVCRSRFDSIIYGLGAESGLAAFDLNSAGSDDFMILDNSRIAAITIIADTTAGGTGSTVHIDEGLGDGSAGAAAGCDNNKPTPKGTRPTIGTTSNVLAAGIRTSASVCRN